MLDLLQLQKSKRKKSHRKSLNNSLAYFGIWNIMDPLNLNGLIMGL